MSAMTTMMLTSISVSPPYVDNTLFAVWCNVIRVISMLTNLKWTPNKKHILQYSQIDCDSYNYVVRTMGHIVLAGGMEPHLFHYGPLC